MHAGTFRLVALLALAAPAWAAEPTAPAAPPLFAALDADGDGRVTAVELQAARAAQIDRFDADGDGRLSAVEYRTWWLDAAQARLTRQFRADDRDGDGMISLDDLIARSGALLKRRDRDGDGAISVEEWRPRRRAPEPGRA
jgi:hypothetical protein